MISLSLCFSLTLTAIQRNGAEKLKNFHHLEFDRILLLLVFKSLLFSFSHSLFHFFPVAWKDFFPFAISFQHSLVIIFIEMCVTFEKNVVYFLIFSFSLLFYLNCTILNLNSEKPTYSAAKKYTFFVLFFEIIKKNTDKVMIIFGFKNTYLAYNCQKKRLYILLLCIMWFFSFLFRRHVYRKTMKARSHRPEEYERKIPKIRLYVVQFLFSLSFRSK